MKNNKKLKKEFIKKCKAKLKSKGILEKEVAKKINMTEETIKAFFNNKNDTKLSTLIKILACLDTTLKI